MPCSLGTKATLTVPPAPEALPAGAAVWFFLVQAPMGNVIARARTTTPVILNLDCTAPPCSPEDARSCVASNGASHDPRCFSHPVITGLDLARASLARTHLGLNRFSPSRGSGIACRHGIVPAGGSSQQRTETVGLVLTNIGNR